MVDVPPICREPRFCFVQFGHQACLKYQDAAKMKVENRVDKLGENGRVGFKFLRCHDGQC